MQKRKFFFWGWAKKNLFQSYWNWLLTLFLLFLLTVPAFKFIQWAFIHASWSGSAEVCRQQSDGACWSFIQEKFIFLLFGFFPRDQIWRGWVSLGLFLLGILYSGSKRHWKFSLVWIWGVLLLAMFLILHGKWVGLKTVETQNWGGLIVTIVLAMVGIYFAYPIGILLALGRTSSMPVIRSFSIILIEFVRGVPFLSVLFLVSLMLPFFLPPGWDVPKLLRAIVAAILFTGCYLAETIRGGLASVNKGQYEAADSLGLGYWKKNILIILPQALGAVIQPTIGSFIALFIDTSLVVIISMYDFLGAARAAMSDPNWLGFGLTMYVFAAFIYFLFCYTLSKYSRRFEREILKKKRH